METPLLAAALIVKNEEKFLPDCLTSLNALRPLLSEICIYDTGSTDRTIEIAEAAGARVERGYWDADFSRARNEAIAMCDAKWVLVVDADERVVAEQPALAYQLRTGLSFDMTGVDGLRLTVSNIAGAGVVGSKLPSVRIMRPGRTQYQGRLHERVVAKAPERDLRVWDIAEPIAGVTHIGYWLAEPGVKETRNLAIAQADVEDSTSSEETVEDAAVRLLNRARSHRGSGVLEGALADYLACWRLDTESGSRLWAGQDLADLLLHIGAFSDAAVIGRELQQDGRQPAYADWVMARARLGQGRSREALDLLRRIDDTSNAAGFSLGTADILEARMIAEAEVGDRDAATACAIRLVAGHGRVDGRLGLLLALWGDRPAEPLAELLAESGPTRVADMRAAALAQGAMGHRLATALEPLTSAASEQP